MLSPVGETEVKPFKSSARGTNMVLETVKEDVVVDCIECSTEVEKRKEGC